MTLIEKWQRWFDPLAGGWTRAGVAGGLPLTGGWFFGRPSGGYILRRGTSAIDVSEVVGAASKTATTATIWPGIPQPAGTYWFGLWPVGPGGVEAIPLASSPELVKVIVDNSGAQEPVPASPRRLRAIALAGGNVRLEWEFVPSANAPDPVEFRVYTDAGSPPVSYAVPAKTVAVRAGRSARGGYGCNLGPYGHGLTVAFVVRTATISAEDENVSAVSVVVDATGPAAHRPKAYTLGDDE